MFKFEINDMEFHIMETSAGFRWMPPSGSGRIFPTLFEAQSDAIKTIQKFIDRENNPTTIDDYWDERRHDNDE